MCGGDLVDGGIADVFLLGVQNGTKGVGLGEGGLSGVSSCISTTLQSTG